MIHHRWRPSWNGTWLLIRPALQMPVIWKLPWTPTAPTKDFVIPCWKWKDLKDWSVFIRFLCLKDWQDMGKEGEGRREKKETWRLDWLGKKNETKNKRISILQERALCQITSSDISVKMFQQDFVSHEVLPSSWVWRLPALTRSWFGHKKSWTRNSWKMAKCKEPTLNRLVLLKHLE